MSVIGISLAETNLAERPSHSQRERERERRVRTLVSSQEPPGGVPATAGPEG